MAPPRSRSIRTPQQDRSRRTLERVHQAALECFETQGFDATTTAMIASRAGIAVGTVYSYFTDKREILLELIDTRVAERTSFVIAELDPSGWGERTPREVVHSLMEALFHTALIQPGVQRIMWERYFKDPEFQQRMAAMREQIRQAVSGFLELLARAGLLAPIDREMASYVIVNAVQWNSTMAFTESAPHEREAVARAMAQMVERYVFASGVGADTPLPVAFAAAPPSADA